MEISLFYASTAFILGALHAIEPGHGKTVVGAYLIGSQGKPIHAVMLGIIVTFTHTFVVILLAAGATLAAQQWAPEEVHHKLELIAGIIIFVMGVWLIRARWPSVSTEGWKESRCHSHRNHNHPVFKDPLGLPALLTLGVSGGIVPCPGALAILLAAISTAKIAEGVLLVIIFSIGLASVLIAVGIIMVTAVSLAKKLFEGNRWLEKLPLISAILITLLGAILTLKSIF